MSIPSLLAPRGPDGRSIAMFQPVGGSVGGSPFSVDEDPAVTSDPITGQAIFVSVTGGVVHMRISAAGTAATTNDFPLPVGVHNFAWRSGDRISFITPASGTAVVHVAACRQVGE